MKMTEICTSYFSGFQELFHYKENDRTTNALALCKIVSYFTFCIPLAFAAAYGAASLYGRLSKPSSFSPADQKVQQQAQKTLFNPGQSHSPTVDLQAVLSAYNPAYIPRLNRANLESYSQSEAYRRHAKTACIYFNADQLSTEEALTVIFRREPTNIGMGPNQYHTNQLQALFGYTKSVYNDTTVRKSNNEPFSHLPNTAAVYAETTLWNPPGGQNQIEIACLSLPAPALDSTQQPHYAYYVQQGSLNPKKYTMEMTFLFKTIEKALRDHKGTAFENKGIKRLVLCRFGQGAFLSALNNESRMVAHQIYKTQLAIFLLAIADTGLQVVMSEYTDPHGDVWHSDMIIGDIVETAREGDLIVNAWDPHSAPGNGNDADRSFDGAMGRGSGILLTQTAWLNETLRKPESAIAVR